MRQTPSTGKTDLQHLLFTPVGVSSYFLSELILVPNLYVENIDRRILFYSVLLSFVYATNVLITDTRELPSLVQIELEHG